MRELLTLTTLISLHFGICQPSKIDEEQLLRYQMFEESAKYYLEGSYERSLEIFDSLYSSTSSKSINISHYKVAYLSCIEISKKLDLGSTTYVDKADFYKSESTKWNGEFMMADLWESTIIKNEDESFEIVDSPPTFPGGIKGLYEYIANSMNYPEEAQIQGLEGTVKVAFVVNKDGTLGGVNALSNIGGGLEEEAERVIRNAANFRPGTQNGEPVYVKLVLPILYQLTDKKKRKRNKN